MALGWSARLEAALAALGTDAEPGRVVAVHRGAYDVGFAGGVVRAKLPGRLRQEAQRGDAIEPCVGDWVTLLVRAAQGGATVEAILPRAGVLSRKMAGRNQLEQLVAANVDFAFLLAPVAAEPNARSLERYVALARAGGVAPVVLLTKADLCDVPADGTAAAPGGAAAESPAAAPVVAAEPARTDVRAAALAALAPVLAGVPVHVVSAATGEGLDALAPYLAPGTTVALLGPSGAGKSTLLNRLAGSSLAAVAEVRADGRGRHTTTRRELLTLPAGALVIDTPGMRELALWDAQEGVRDTFPEVEALAVSCRFGDCTHEREPGCAVRAAVEAGTLPAERLEGFLKLQREQERSEKLRAERARAAEPAGRPGARRRR